MPRQICIALTLTPEELALVKELAKQMQCSKTEVVQLALRFFLRELRSKISV